MTKKTAMFTINDIRIKKRNLSAEKTVYLKLLLRVGWGGVGLN